MSSIDSSICRLQVLSAMEKYRDVFFVIKLQPHALAKQDVVVDPDQLIACDLMDGRDAFLTMAREKHWEFSTLRRTKYSTMAMLHEIHNSSRDAFVYTCNLCRGQVETRYHCTVCEVSVSNLSGRLRRTKYQSRSISGSGIYCSLVRGP